MDDKLHSAKDVSVPDPASASTSSTPPTAAVVDTYARRSCPRCGRRMSALQFDKHTFCVVCRDIKCSLATRSKECKAWSKDFMLGYVKHQRTLVSKARRAPLSSSPSPPVTAVTTASLVSPPSETFSEDRLRQLMYSMFQDLMSASVGTRLIPLLQLLRQCLIRPLSVQRLPGGLESVTPSEAPSIEFPGVALPTTQVDLPPPPPYCVCVCVICS